MQQASVSRNNSTTRKQPNRNKQSFQANTKSNSFFTEAQLRPPSSKFITSFHTRGINTPMYTTQIGTPDKIRVSHFDDSLNQIGKQGRNTRTGKMNKLRTNQTRSRKNNNSQLDMGMYFSHQGVKGNRIQSAAYKRNNKSNVNNSIDSYQQINQSLQFKNSYQTNQPFSSNLDNSVNIPQPPYNVSSAPLTDQLDSNIYQFSENTNNAMGVPPNDGSNTELNMMSNVQ